MKVLYTIFSILIASSGAFAQGFNVKSFTADIYLDTSGYFDVVENYDLDFTQEKHGIYREINTDYKIQTSDGKEEKRKLVL
ncbi:MAG: DUF2207 domain-containing protein, partial [Chitinophagaceae bacterium]